MVWRRCLKAPSIGAACAPGGADVDPIRVYALLRYDAPIGEHDLG